MGGEVPARRGGYPVGVSSPRNQPQYQVRFDWGVEGADAIAPGAHIVVWADALGGPVPTLEHDGAIIAGTVGSRRAIAEWVLAMMLAFEKEIPQSWVHDAVAAVHRDAAGVCLLSDDLRRFPWAVGLARDTLKVVRQNLFWAFIYNACGIGLAVCGRLNPIWAALAMALSSILVIGNSLRLSRYPDLPELSDAPFVGKNAQTTTTIAITSTRPRAEFAGVST